MFLPVISLPHRSENGAFKASLPEKTQPYENAEQNPGENAQCIGLPVNRLFGTPESIHLSDLAMAHRTLPAIELQIDGTEGAALGVKPLFLLILHICHIPRSVSLNTRLR